MSNKSDAYWSMLPQCGIALEESTQIERVQKSALRIILGGSYHTYKNALEQMQLETLYSRRQRLCVKFARKCLKSNNSVTGSKLKTKKQ